MIKAIDIDIDINIDIDIDITGRDKEIKRTNELCSRIGRLEVGLFIIIVWTIFFTGFSWITNKSMSTKLLMMSEKSFFKI